MSPRRVLHQAGQLALSLGAVVGALSLVVTLAGVCFGVRPVIFLSGSMSPAIPAGSLALTRLVPAADLRTGDVVAVPVGDKLVTHRIVAITHHEGTATLRLRGDANASTDDQPSVVEAAPRVLLSVPHAGRLVAWFSRTPGVFVLAGYAGLLLALVLRQPAPGASGRRSEDSGRPSVSRSVSRRKGGPRHAARAMLRAFAATTVLGLGTFSAAPARAAWGDSVLVSGSTVGTYTVPAPATFTCGGVGVLTVTFNWTAVAGATNYTLHYGNGGAQTRSVAGTSSTVVTAIVNGTAWVQANRNFGSTTWTSAASATLAYKVAAVSVCPL